MTTGYFEPAHKWNIIEVLISSIANYFRNDCYLNKIKNHVDYIAIAKASNLDAVKEIITTTKKLDIKLDSLDKGLNFIHIKCGLDDEVPRPPLDVVKVGEFK